MRRLQLQTSWGELSLVGGARAGEGSLVLLPQLRVALDAGRPARPLVPMRHVVASHGHLDHVLGLAAWASQRHLQGLPGGTVYAAPALATRIAELLALLAAMEGGKPYDVDVRKVSPGDTIEVRPGIRLGFFPTSHWVETLGSRVEWARRRLRPELAGVAPEELQRRREGGEEITEEARVNLLAYLADTGPEVLDREPWLADVEILVVECTFLRADDRERARRFGHIHLDDLAERAEGLRNRHLVLTHLSRRHRLGAGTRLIRRRLEPLLAPKLHLLNVEWE